MIMTWRWFLAILGGLAVTLSGLFWDALIHEQEHGHLAEASLLNLSDPGHIVFGLGLVLTVLITLSGFTTSWLGSPQSEIGWRRLSVPAVLWVMIGLAGVITLAALARTG